MSAPTENRKNCTHGLQIEDCEVCREPERIGSSELVVRRPLDVTRRAQEQCSGWLSECLKLGWRKDQLDTLENIWWEHHDRLGALKAHNDRTEPLAP